MVNLGHFRTKASEFLGHSKRNLLALGYLMTFQNKKNKRTLFQTLFKNKYQYSEKKLTEITRSKNINYQLAETNPWALKQTSLKGVSPLYHLDVT